MLPARLKSMVCLVFLAYPLEICFLLTENFLFPVWVHKFPDWVHVFPDWVHKFPDWKHKIP